MRFTKLLSPPKLSWWWRGTPVIGVLSPVVLNVLIGLGGYFPPGGLWPDSSLWSGGTHLWLEYFIVLILLAGGLVWSLLSWNWRPAAIAMLFAVCGYAGLWPARAAGGAMREIAFELFSVRSHTLITAIEAFVRDEGSPPKTLDALVPTYLATIPTTGMATGADYFFSPEPGACSKDNTWEIRVEPHYPPLETLLYCPKRDYERSAWGGMGREIGTWFLITY